MTPKETRAARLAPAIIARLEARHYNAYYAATAAEARDLVLQLMPDGSSVTWGGSMTMQACGLVEALHDAGQYDVWDRAQLPPDQDKHDFYVRAFAADYYIASANAMTEDGLIVNIDGNGNRVAAITYGPRNVILLVGINKVCGTLDAAIDRARRTAAPINAARFDIATPCQRDGKCHDCHSTQSICNYISVMRHSFPEHRHTVILIGEELGY